MSKNSIAYRFILLIVLVSSIFTLLLSAFQLQREYTSDVQTVLKQLDLIELSYLDSLSDKVWLVDEEAIRILLDGISKLPDIQQVTVLTQNDEKFSISVTTPSQYVIERVYPLHYDYRGQAMVLGELQVSATLEQTYQRLFERIGWIVVGNALKTFAVSLCIIAIFQRLIGNHLQQIVDYLSRFNLSSNTTTKLRLKRRIRKPAHADELDQLVNTINQIRHDLQESYGTLAATEAQYRNLVEDSVQGVLIHRSWKVLFVNNSMVQILGYESTAELAAIDSVFQLIAPVDRERLKKYAEARMRGDFAPNRYEFTALRKNGTAVTLAAIVRQVRWEGAVALQLSAIDISDHKRAEQALRRSERRFRQITENIQEVFYSYDPINHKTLYVSPGYEWLYGRSASDLFIDPFLFVDTIHPMDRKRFQQTYLRHMSGQPGETIYRIIRPDGGLRWIRDRGFPIKDETGAVYRMIGFAADITELKQAQEALYAEKERIRVTLHSIGDGVITTDRQAIIDYLNPAAERVTGWSLSGAKNQPLNQVFNIIDEQTREPITGLVSRCLTEGKTVNLIDQLLLISQHGQEYAIENSVAPIRYENGKVQGVVIVFKDVTKARELTQQMAHDATHDALTGLINRREFEKRLQQALDSAKQYGTRHVLSYIDLDHFKVINDTAGHAAGDELLKQIKQLCTQEVRERDTFARLGGDEFCLLLDNCPLERGVAITQNLLQRIREYPFIWGEHSFQIGASIGLLAFGEEATNISQVLSQADSACYLAKRQGRNRVCIYS